MWEACECELLGGVVPKPGASEAAQLGEKVRHEGRQSRVSWKGEAVCGLGYEACETGATGRVAINKALSCRRECNAGDLTTDERKAKGRQGTRDLASCKPGACKQRCCCYPEPASNSARHLEWFSKQCVGRQGSPWPAAPGAVTVLSSRTRSQPVPSTSAERLQPQGLAVGRGMVDRGMVDWGWWIGAWLIGAWLVFKHKDKELQLGCACGAQKVLVLNGCKQCCGGSSMQQAVM